MSGADHNDVAGADKHAACKSVLETSELLELILTFVPAKNIFGSLRVSKYWNNVITDSVSLQHKMFLRLSDKPHELWTVDAHHEPGADYYAPRNKHLKDTVLKLRRINLFPHSDMPIVKPLNLSPMLRKNSLSDSNALQVYVSGVVNKSNISVVYLRYSGWVDLFQHDISLSKTYLTDPGCHNADVVGFTLYFGNYNYFSGNWQPVEVPAHAYGQDHDGMLYNVASVRSDVCFCGGEASVRSDEALTMGDILKSAFNARSDGWSTLPETDGVKGKWKTTYEILDELKGLLGAKDVPRRAYTVMYIRVFSVGGDSQIIIPKDEERAQANAGWDSLQRN